MREPGLDKTKGDSEVTIVWKYSSSFLFTLHQVNKTSWRQKDLNYNCEDDALEQNICCYSQRRIWKTENLNKGLLSKCFLCQEYVGHLLSKMLPYHPNKGPIHSTCFFPLPSKYPSLSSLHPFFPNLQVPLPILASQCTCCGMVVPLCQRT